jgi:hypothetical protein
MILFILYRCSECTNGTQYLLEKQTSPGTCTECPTTQALCYGGSNIGPQPGYWRKSNTTTVFIKCINTEACLGIIPPDYDPQGTCAEYYNGVLCGDCESGYSRNSDY